MSKSARPRRDNVYTRLLQLNTKLDRWGMPDIDQVPVEGPGSDHPMAFKWYQPEHKVLGKRMKDWLKPSGAIWHVFNPLGDPFGGRTASAPWLDLPDTMAGARERFSFFAAFCRKMRVPFYAFHGSDVIPSFRDFVDFESQLRAMGDHMLACQKEFGIKCAWATNNSFSQKVYALGAGTSRNRESFVQAAAENSVVLDVAKQLGAQGYVVWDGRGGYSSPWATDIGLEIDCGAALLTMLVEYAQKNDCKVEFYIEPKGREPKSRMYFSSVETVLNFLQANPFLWDHFKLNVETNHGTMEGLSVFHELTLAAKYDKLGSIDANMGQLMLGWDTDNPVQDAQVALQLTYPVVRAGERWRGFYNFDCKQRREDFEPIDLFWMYYTSLEHLGLGLRAAGKLVESGVMQDYLADQYASWREAAGQAILEGHVSLDDCRETMRTHGTIAPLKSAHESVLLHAINDVLTNPV